MYSTPGELDQSLVKVLLAALLDAYDDDFIVSR